MGEGAQLSIADIVKTQEVSRKHYICTALGTHPDFSSFPHFLSESAKDSAG